jgi:predicted transcriptional regulator
MSDKVQNPTITGCKTKSAEGRVDKAKDGYIAKILAGEIKDPPLATQRKILKELGIGENNGI